MDTPLCVEGYKDVDYERDVDKQRSTFGYAFMLNGGAVSWWSCLQNCVSMSFIEAEYIAMIEACKEALWIAHLMREVGVQFEILMLYYCDSHIAILLVKNWVFNVKTNHILMKYQFGASEGSYNRES